MSTLAEVIAASLWTISAVCMLLLNKALIVVFPYTFTIVLLQNTVAGILIGTVVFWIAFSEGDRWPRQINKDTCILFIPVTALFLIVLCTGLEVFKYVSVITFVAMRYTTCIISYLGDIFILGHQYHHEIMVPLVVIMIGAAVYSSSDLQFSAVGYLYMAANFFALSGFSLFVKWADKGNDLGVFVMSLFNNTQSLPPLVLLAFLSSELPKTAIDAMDTMTSDHVWIFVGSCVAGACVSVTGFYAQKLYTATAWTIQANLNKIPTMILSYIFFHDPVTVGTIVGAVILLIGGLLYSLAAIRVKDRARYQPLPSEEPEPPESHGSINSTLPSERR